MRLDTIKREGDDTIEERMMCREVCSMLRLAVQCLSSRAGRLGHVCSLLGLCAALGTEYSIARTHFQPTFRGHNKHALKP